MAVSASSKIRHKKKWEVLNGNNPIRVQDWKTNNIQEKDDG